MTVFDWGAARTMPFLPRLRYGRTILSPARWRLEAAELPGPLAALARVGRRPDHLAGTAPRPAARAPDRGGPAAALDLDQPGHRVLLRAHLRTGPDAVLTEAPGPGDAGWCGGRPHEVIVTLTATDPPPWPRLPAPCPERVTRGQGHAPAASTTLLACLYGDIHRQDTILAEYLPGLLARLGQPAWWYIRYRDPGQHLRLRITLADPAAFGEAAEHDQHVGR